MRLLLSLLALAVLLTAPAGGASASEDEAFDRDSILARSQAAVGSELGSFTLLNRRGEPVDLADYRGRPLLISPVYTSCPFVCRANTRELADAVRKARQALGADSFNVITVGFDTANDTPGAMTAYARHQGVNFDNWAFLSGDQETVDRLMDRLGFTYRASPRGFDHLVQTTIVDANGVIRAQVYGEPLLLPQLVEPLKRIVLGVDPKQDDIMDSLVKRVKFFCTNYDPAADAYRFDYSLFIGIAIGALIILVTGGILVRWVLQARREAAKTNG